MKTETKYNIKGKQAITAKNKNRQMVALKKGRTWKGFVVTPQGYQLLRYTAGTMECELAAFVWDSVEIY